MPEGHGAAATPRTLDGMPAQVSIIMGSDSDWRVMEAAKAVLDELGVAAEVDVVSAHRTPQKMVDFARGAADRGVRVIIAGAGTFIDLNPADFGGRIEVDTGCVVAFEEGIRYGVQRVGGLDRQGIMNAVFGGEGLSLATLEGDGRVVLQSLTLESLANALKKDQGGDKQGPTGGLFSTRVG